MITSSPTAPLGSVTHQSSYLPSDFLPTDAILCRNTSPLITLAFGLIQRGVGVHVLGRDIGANLIRIIERANANDLPELAARLTEFQQAETKKAVKKGDNCALAAIEDKYNCLFTILRHSTGITHISERINSLFEDTSRQLLTLSTIHKAKGLEWPRVFILDFDLMPSRWATQDWQKRQERNLQYVAITRAKQDLVYIKSDQWKQ